MADMLVKLYPLPTSPGLEDALRAKGIVIKRALAPDLSKIIAFTVENDHPEWADEIRVCFMNQPASCYIAVKNKEIVGFGCYESTARGFFGPTLVKDSERRQGIGKILLLKCLESLRELGYACHAVHNHYGSFYDRNQVFSNLGFDTFTSVEYMENVEQTPRGWATDACLTQAVLKALDSTESRDLVYTITVQGHWKYDAENGEFGQLPVTVKSGMDDPDAAYSMGYYMSLIQGTDQFVAELLRALAYRGEPSVVVALV